MSDELSQAIADANAKIQKLPLPATLKVMVGIGAYVGTGIAKKREAAVASRLAELERFGIKYSDPFDWNASRRLETAQRAEASNMRIAEMAAMRERLDANAAAMPRGPGFKVPRASAAWEGAHPNDAGPGPRIDARESAFERDVGG